MVVETWLGCPGASDQPPSACCVASSRSAMRRSCSGRCRPSRRLTKTYSASRLAAASTRPCQCPGALPREQRAGRPRDGVVDARDRVGPADRLPPLMQPPPLPPPGRDHADALAAVITLRVLRARAGGPRGRRRTEHRCVAVSPAGRQRPLRRARPPAPPLEPASEAASRHARSTRTRNALGARSPSQAGAARCSHSQLACGCVAPRGRASRPGRRPTISSRSASAVAAALCAASPYQAKNCCGKPGRPSGSPAPSDTARSATNGTPRACAARAAAAVSMSTATGASASSVVPATSQPKTSPPPGLHANGRSPKGSSLLP